MRQNRPATMPKALTLKRFFVLACALVFLVAAFVPVSFAASSAATYSNSGCTASQTAFKLGDTVHGYGSGLTSGTEIIFEYTSPGATGSTTSPVSSGTTLCDTTGYAPTTAGTWTPTVAVSM